MKDLNLNDVWAHLIIEEFYRQGVRCVSLSSGSRSSPLTVAAAEHPGIECIVHYDERGAAFFAVGWGRATGMPALVITTSGTAVANAFPAVIEAAKDHVPLILLTADRPPELRDTGANQTIDQVKIFGEYVRWNVDLPCPTQDIDPAMVLTTVDQIWFQTLNTKGPTHLNCMFREPLTSTDRDFSDVVSLKNIQKWRDGESLYTSYPMPTVRLEESKLEEVASALSSVKQGIIVVGKLDHPEQSKAVSTLIAAMQWPVFPDSTSGLKVGNHSPYIISHCDQILVSQPATESTRPEAVLHVGGAIVSKRLLHFIKQSRPKKYIVVKEHAQRQDPFHHVTTSIQTNLEDFCCRFASIVKITPDPSWLSQWLTYSDKIGEKIRNHFSGMNELNEPLIARLVSAELPENHGLVLGNSMPICDMDMYGACDGSSIRIIANRGASGIDGLIATAAGYAQGTGSPVTVIIGDLTCLHDLNSLAFLKKIKVPVTLIVINNDGGGIFSFLPVSKDKNNFEPYFGTPHGLSLQGGAKLFQLDYKHPQTADEFVKDFEEATQSDQSTLIEVFTDRQKNYELHETLLRIKEE